MLETNEFDKYEIIDFTEYDENITENQTIFLNWFNDELKEK